MFSAFQNIEGVFPGFKQPIVAEVEDYSVSSRTAASTVYNLLNAEDLECWLNKFNFSYSLFVIATEQVNS